MTTLHDDAQVLDFSRVLQAVPGAERAPVLHDVRRPATTRPLGTAFRDAATER